MLPDPVNVWLVREGRPEATPGTLSLSPSTVSFHPEDGPALEIPLENVVRARRRVGTPILAIRRRERGSLYVYFAPPPPLAGTPDPTPSRLPRSRRRGRRRSIGALRSAGTARKALIREWVEAIERARAGRLRPR